MQLPTPSLPWCLHAPGSTGRAPTKLSVNWSSIQLGWCDRLPRVWPCRQCHCPKLVLAESGCGVMQPPVTYSLLDPMTCPDPRGKRLASGLGFDLSAGASGGGQGLGLSARLLCTLLRAEAAELHGPCATMHLPSGERLLPTPCTKHETLTNVVERTDCACRYVPPIWMSTRHLQLSYTEGGCTSRCAHLSTRIHELMARHAGLI